jgi:hypothetical protein
VKRLPHRRRASKKTPLLTLKKTCNKAKVGATPIKTRYLHKNPQVTPKMMNPSPQWIMIRKMRRESMRAWKMRNSKKRARKRETMKRNMKKKGRLSKKSLNKKVRMRIKICKRKIRSRVVKLRELKKNQVL